MGKPVPPATARSQRGPSRCPRGSGLSWSLEHEKQKNNDQDKDDCATTNVHVEFLLSSAIRGRTRKHNKSCSALVVQRVLGLTKYLLGKPAKSMAEVTSRQRYVERVPTVLAPPPALVAIPLLTRTAAPGNALNDRRPLQRIAWFETTTFTVMRKR